MEGKKNRLQLELTRVATNTAPTKPSAWLKKRRLRDSRVRELDSPNPKPRAIIGKTSAGTAARKMLTCSRSAWRSFPKMISQPDRRVIVKRGRVPSLRSADKRVPA